MEFVGRSVTKEFKGIGAFTGVVKSYDSKTGFFEIGYEDGDSEEIDFSELAVLLEVDGVVPDHSVSMLAEKENLSRVGQRPKKRRRVFETSNSEGGLTNETVVADNLTKNPDFSGCNNNHNVNSNHVGLDLNCGSHDLDNHIVNGNDNELDLNMNLQENDGDSKEKDLAHISIKKDECFDLNMDIDEENNKNQDIDLGGYSKEIKTQEVSGDIVAESPLDLVNQNSPNINQTNDVDSHGNLGKAYPGKKRGRKKRKVSDTLNTPTSESVLRRSARRRAKSSEDVEPNAIKFDGVDSSLPSPVISAVSEDQPTISGCEESKEPVILPPTKLELPPSTGNLNLDGLPILELFSVYAFLRSFSTILFLSPFELGDFVASIRSDSPSLLIDSIHVSLLRILRKHLEFLSSENSKSATNCLRDLNWDLLDVITWPIFMIEYLLTKPDFDLSHLKLHKTDYYKQPEFVKVQILQYLCDDVIEVEAISSEITRRTLVGEYTNVMESNQQSKAIMSKKRRATRAISGNLGMSEEVIDETADRNSDECCLCKMDGNLLCCDGCPGAYHSKCVGIANNSLPEGKWFCPECVVDKKNHGINVAKAIRGAEVLGLDPQGRWFYSSCSYVVVSDDSDAETKLYYYHMSDLTTLVNALSLLNGPYRAISNAITKSSRLYKKCYEICVKDKTAPEDLPLAPSTGSSDVSETVAGIPNSSKSELDSLKESKMTTRKTTLENGYLNLYSFARVASSVAGEWTRKISDKTSQLPTKSLEELISIQMKSISKTPVDFCWSNVRNLSVDVRKDKCGWCLACKFPADDGDCLFFMNNLGVLESFKSELLGFDSKIQRKDRLVDVMCHILCIEDRLHGLLLGPWVNPHFAKLYRKSFLEASDIAPVKDLLLMLESNIWVRALSDDWQKHVDSVVTVGSASHIVTKNSRNVIGKKRNRSLGSEPHSLRNTSTGLGLYWWRGGGLTRQLFNWKGLPSSLASKAARQGGGKKIESILYPENYEFLKRPKVLVWRAAVESAVTVEQLALQVRELDANIKWEEIENTSHVAKMDKESLKSWRSFKKATIRRKSSEGGTVKYLLDFAKRRFIPDAVVKHGSKFEDPDGKKKYWVKEAYVPLFLLKPFEDRRIGLKSNKAAPTKLPISLRRSVKKSSRKLGFSYLFERAEKSESRRCGHCNKDVPIRDAVSCQYCEGFFHKRHVKKTSGGVTECMYTCHKCHAGETVKVSPKKGKLPSRKTKISSKSKTTKTATKGKQTQAKGRTVIVPLRRSARTAKLVSIQKKMQIKKKKPVKKKKQVNKKKDHDPDPAYEVNQVKRKPGRPRKIARNNNNNIFRKRRSQSTANYWLNGLLLSRKVAADDERVKEFRTQNHIFPFLDSIADQQPKCRLCEESEFKSELNYISCGTCKDWYHGDAFGLKEEHIGIIKGFKCHNCRVRAPPVCPHLKTESNLDQLKTDEVASEAVLEPKSAEGDCAENGKEDLKEKESLATDMVVEDGGSEAKEVPKLAEGDCAENGKEDLKEKESLVTDMVVEEAAKESKTSVVEEANGD